MNNKPKKEKWKPIIINNKETKYFISNYGFVMNGKTKRILKPSRNKGGYYYVNLTIDGKGHSQRIHRLVANAFIKNPKNKPEVNHKDGNKENNSVENLEWSTRKENQKHAFENGLIIKKEKNIKRLTDKKIHRICQLIESNKYSIKKIANLTNTSRQTVSKIVTKKNHKNISDLYDFTHFDNHGTNLTGNRHPKIKYKNKDIKRVCELIDKNKYTLREISNKTFIDYQTVRNVYYGVCRTDISSKYDFYKYKGNILHDNKVKLVHNICELLDSGLNTREVSEKLNIKRHIVRQILSGCCWINISKDYKFMKKKMCE